MRDDFPEDVKRTVAARIGNHCSNPECRALTSGPQVDPSKSLNVGVAAHITAASPGGPRYNPTLSPEERRSVENAIWLCQNCAKLVDNDPARYDESLLRRWKADAEKEALIQIGKTAGAVGLGEPALAPEEVAILVAAAKDGVIIVIRTEQVGDWVRAGSEDFVKVDGLDPAFSASYLDALEVLCHRGLVRRDEDCSYTLTGRGFKTARALSPTPSADLNLQGYQIGSGKTLVGLKAFDKVEIRPAIPRSAESDPFIVEQIETDFLSVRKESSQQEIRIPGTGVARVLNFGNRRRSIVDLDGRLQWITRTKNWIFLPEKPRTDSILGISKPSTLRDQSALSIISDIRDKNYEPAWASEVDVPGRIGADLEVVYDDDGLYFRSPDKLHDLILVKKLK